MKLSLAEYESQHAEWLKADQQVRAEMDIEKSILEDLSKQLSEAVDFEILAGMLATMGWTKFEIPRFIDNHHAVDISYWLADYCQGEYKRNGRTFLFKESKDATMFILRWGS